MRHAGIAVGVIVGLWSLGGIAAYLIAPIVGVNSGEVGDTFGAVNALFSGLAFAGVIFAILLQRSELKLQRHELELTRLELAGQKEQLKAQNDTLRQQTFENTFFQLLRLHHEIVNAIDLRKGPSSDVIATGRDCMEVFYRRLHKQWNKPGESYPDGTDLDRINAAYMTYYASVESDLGHYYRSLYNIIKFVDRSSVQDKRLYTNLIRAQLSKYELGLLFYNCLSEMGAEKFKPLVERYSLLKMVPRKELFNPDGHMRLFSDDAFGGPTSSEGGVHGAA